MTPDKSPKPMPFGAGRSAVAVHGRWPSAKTRRWFSFLRQAALHFYENISLARFSIYSCRLREFAAECITDHPASHDYRHAIGQRQSIRTLSAPAFCSGSVGTVRGRSLALGCAAGIRAR
jgi:hypothetical protein